MFVSSSCSLSNRKLVGKEEPVQLAMRNWNNKSTRSVLKPMRVLVNKWFCLYCKFYFVLLIKFFYNIHVVVPNLLSEELVEKFRRWLNDLHGDANYLPQLKFLRISRKNKDQMIDCENDDEQMQDSWEFYYHLSQRMIYLYTIHISFSVLLTLDCNVVYKYNINYTLWYDNKIIIIITKKLKRIQILLLQRWGS